MKVNNEVVILPTKEKLYTLNEVKTIALDVMNLGMQLRQNQLNGSDTRSGNEVLDKYFLENIK